MQPAEVTAQLHIARVERHDAADLATLFAGIDTAFFRPHPMTLAEAERIASLAGADTYLIGRADSNPVAYGMLRGWDEGYSIPMLGIAVRRDHLLRGFGRAMMLALHDAARRAGAPGVRLRAHPDNLPAAALYRSLGYRKAGVERGEDLLLLDFDRE